MKCIGSQFMTTWNAYAPPPSFLPPLRACNAPPQPEPSAHRLAPSGAHSLIEVCWQPVHNHVESIVKGKVIKHDCPHRWAAQHLPPGHRPGVSLHARRRGRLAGCQADGDRGIPAVQWIVVGSMQWHARAVVQGAAQAAGCCTTPRASSTATHIASALPGPLRRTNLRLGLCRPTHTHSSTHASPASPTSRSRAPGPSSVAIEGSTSMAAAEPRYMPAHW